MRPIFFDPTARRWRQVKAAASVVAAALGLGLGGLFVAITVAPVLPPLPLTSSKRAAEGHAGPARPRERPARREASGPRRDLARPWRRHEPAGARIRAERLAFFVDWDDNSLVSLRHNLGEIDTLVPEWLHLVDGSGRIREDDPVRRAQAEAVVRAAGRRIGIVPLVNNFDGERWRSDWLAGSLRSKASRAALVEALHGFVSAHGYAGVNVDFEAVPRGRQRDLATFMSALYARFHPEGLVVSQSVPVDDASFDFRRLASASDYLVLMAYDEHASDTEPGPVASAPWFARALRARFAEVPARKLVVGLGSYGYDWTRGSTPARELSFQEALQTAQEAGAEVALQPGSANPSYRYTDARGRAHQVWFLDAVTAFNEVASAFPLAPRGFALWRLGSEDPATWRVLGRERAPDADGAAALSSLRAGYDIDYQGHGEVLRVTGTPREGRREVHFDRTVGEITASTVQEFPSGYRVTRWGGSESHDIALTFDDGPDPGFTPAILDVLRSRGAPATFFVVGENAVASPALLARIASEGHEIGNHTYTHPNLSEVGDRRLALEVNAVQRLLESRLGRSSLLFRPPYAEDVEPETPDQVRPLLATSALGYYTVGLDIDPGDWKKPGVDEIVGRVLEAARAGEGHVVLLHDGGGDRSQTVAALPRIIDGLRSEGFHLVPVSKLLGLSSAAVMPPLPEQARLDTELAGAGFAILTFTERLAVGLLALGLGLALLRFVLVIVFASLERRRPGPAATAPPCVSLAVVIPAWNESAVICQTVRSLLASDGGPFPILVVDDGSTDGTADRVREGFGNEPRVRVIAQANAGKWAALNRGFASVDADVVIAVDADTIFRPETVRLLAAHFEDPRVGAVAGNARVGNLRNLLTRFQALEYVTSQNLDRRAFAWLECIPVVPGAVGAWRREAVLGVQGYGDDTLAEDADLTLRLLRAGWRVRYEDRAIALTEAPETVGAFLRQRFRWTFGTLQAGWKHRKAAFRARPRALAWIALPNLFVFGELFPLIAPFMDLALAASLAEASSRMLAHPPDPVPLGLFHVVAFYLLFLLADAVPAALAFRFEPGADRRLLWWLVPQRLCYRQLLVLIAFRSLLTALRGPRVAWTKLERTASVPSG